MFLVFLIAKVEVQRAASGGTLCVEKSSQTRAVLILVAWVTPWLPSWNSGVTLVRSAPSRMPPKRSHRLGNIKKNPLPSVAPTHAVGCAAAGGTATDMVDDEGYSTCSGDSDSDSTCSEDSDCDMGRPVVRRQSTLTMHWAQQAFQDTQEPVPGRGELFQMQGQSAVWSCDNRLVFERAFFASSPIVYQLCDAPPNPPM
jgi:hypothetical protein